jgi:hypothetical protein
MGAGAGLGTRGGVDAAAGTDGGGEGVPARLCWALAIGEELIELVDADDIVDVLVGRL